MFVCVLSDVVGGGVVLLLLFCSGLLVLDFVVGAVVVVSMPYNNTLPYLHPNKKTLLILHTRCTSSTYETCVGPHIAQHTHKCTRRRAHKVAYKSLVIIHLPAPMLREIMHQRYLRILVRIKYTEFLKLKLSHVL